MAKTETRKMLAAAVAAAQDKQAVDLRVLELDPAESSLTDFFLVMSGTNSRQIQTLADEIELRVKRDFGEMPNSREGYRQAEWVLLDYVDFVVHIFSEEKRAYYGIERLRKSAISRDPASVKAAGKKAVGKKAVSKKTVGKKAVGKKAVRRKTAGKKAAGRKSASKSATAKRKRG
jgi:ribosome-associated protein